MKYFRDLDLDILKDKVVVLDIDGTITYDKEESVPDSEANKLYELSKIAKKIYLVSNGRPERTKKISEQHEITYHVSEHKKPNKRVLEHEYFSNRDSVVVVGDKFLTDGLLAIQHGIPFLHVKSLQKMKESFLTKTIFWVDDILGYLFEIFKLLRIKQWIKNLLVFAPAFFAVAIFQIDILITSIIAFLAFCLSSSLVYIFNDISDMNEDRLHHKKKWRPLPSNSLTVHEAKLTALFISAILALVLVYLPTIIPIIFLYISSNILYTIKLKTIPVFDVVLVATMYVMRVVAGGLATSLFVSPWLLACTFFASLFIISCKRYVEFQNPVRKVLNRYSEKSLNSILLISATLSMSSYVLYTILGSHVQNVLYTSPFVIAVFFIILNDIYHGNAKIETPETYLLTNRHIRFVILGWLAIMFFLTYKIF